MSAKSTRQGQACRHCHVRKIRCEGAQSGDPCANCRVAGVACVPHVRKRKHVDVDTSNGRSPSVQIVRPRGAIGNIEGPHEPSYLGRADYLDTHAPIDEDQVSRYQRSPEQTTTSAASISLPSLEGLATRSARDSLVASFLSKCRSWMPVVNAAQVHAMFEANTTPTFLMLAILVAGSKVSTSPHANELGQRCYLAAKQRFYSDDAIDALDTIRGTVILQWWNQTGPEHISIDNSSLWLRLGVALAHQSGLHRQPDARNSQYALRRKIWWTLVSRDNQIATSHGRPRAVHPEDSDVRPLDLQDFEDGDPDAALFINFERITSILGDLTQVCLRGELSHRRRAEIQDRLLAWLRNVPPSFHLHNRSTGRSTPYNFGSRQLHLPYFVSLIILFRQKTPSNCPPAISLLAASFISGIFEEYLDWGDIAFVSPPSIFYLLVASLVQISSHRFSFMTTHRERERRVTRQALEALKKRFHTAVGAERIIQSMDKVSSQASITSCHLSLDLEQRELLAVFGQELCIQWDPVNVAVNGMLTKNLSNRAAQSPRQGNGYTVGAPAQLPQAPPAELIQDNSIYDDSGWTGTLFPQMGQDAQADLFGQWWWSDLVPDL